MVLESLSAAAGVWLWDNYGKEFVDKLGDKAKDRWSRFNWQNAADKYRHKVALLYGTTRILGKHEPVPLEGIFTDVFILDRPTALHRYDLDELKERFAEYGRHVQLYETRHGGLDLVSRPDSQRLYILGKPGAGKTTFLRYITLQAVIGDIDKVPIFISLKEWSDSGLELMAFIVEQFEICSFPEAEPFIERLLQTGQAMVLFDGLDEVNLEGGQRSVVIDVLSNFSKQYHTYQCLITCRIAATDYSFERFTYVEMADFNDEQMRTFVKNWFPDEALQVRFFAEFFSAENEGLRELGRTPLLLSLLCLAFEETLTFPQRRVEIYEEAVDALLKKWDSSRNIRRDEVYRKLSLGRKRQMFARIAAETFEAGDYFIRQRDLEKRIVAYLQHLPPLDGDPEIDAEAFLKSIETQHGIFVERARKIYSFAHLTFQEYFTAKYITDSRTFKSLISHHLTDARWREVFLLTASLLDKADEFFGLFQQAVDTLVAGDEALVELLNWANRRAAAIETPYKPAALRTLYIYFDLALNLALDLDLDLDLARDFALDLALDLDRDLDLDLARDRALDRDLARTVDLARALDLARDLDLDRALTRALARALARDLARDLKLDLNLLFALYFAQVFSLAKGAGRVRNHIVAFTAYFSQVTQLSQEAGSPDLTQALKVLEVPAEGSLSTTWNHFSEQLRTIAHTHRDLEHTWDLTTPQFDLLITYLKANQLLLDCLKVAYVTNRAEIEAGLLLSPGGG